MAPSKKSEEPTGLAPYRPAQIAQWWPAPPGDDDTDSSVTVVAEAERTGSNEVAVYVRQLLDDGAAPVATGTVYLSTRAARDLAHRILEVAKD